MKPSEFLIEVKKLIDTPDKWLKGRYSSQDELDIKPIKFCMEGACLHLSAAGMTFGYIRSVICFNYGDGVNSENASITNFNDLPDTTHEKVMAVMDKAISLAQEDEKHETVSHIG